ncbi:MAG TPA: FAD-dependent oxidoreductase [Caulobacteraceae bacterium]
MSGFDRIALPGKLNEPERRVDILVIGGGPAGAAAARKAARSGASVLLVDENPLDPGLMGLDVPLWFGGRYTNEIQRPERLMEQVFAANPDLEAALDAGAEIALGVSCWGAWVPGWGLAALPGAIAGLADSERAWTVGFEALVVAAGARDVALAFGGWDQPGVMGARAFASLVSTYDAFAGRRIAILGSGELALQTARLAQSKGVEIAAVIEVGATALSDFGDIPAIAGAVPVAAGGGIGGVTSLEIAAGPDRRAIDCDTIVEAISLTPAIELLDVLGVDLAMQPTLGGYAPVSADGVSTSLSQVFVAGDAAGAPGGAPLAREDAALSGLLAARAALPSLGRGVHEPAAPQTAAGPDAVAYQAAWLAAFNEANAAGTIVCQCEAVSREALLAVRPPAYLGPPSRAQSGRDLARLLDDGPPNPDQIKRLTRAGMGPCQGRRCREQIALTLTAASNLPPQRAPLTSYRAPVRPLPLKVLAAWDETPAMSRGWDVWMGISGQWTPYDDIGTEREALSAGILGGEG